ncbi:hypothetical protein F4778DRAFT_593500 [Xylariomycetidae sp. FL2044]|nr:hypothetical protein F4778DRAFT_593500 [Xylariomycetidae sp. FL2044]
MDPLRGSSPPKTSATFDSPEQLLDAFKAAALSVTKLYKTSAAAQAKARSDGYQDCLDDLLSFLNKRNIGVSDGEGWQIRRWATERLDGRDGGSQIAESEDEVERTETVSSPETPRSNSTTHLAPFRGDPNVRTVSAPPTSQPSTVPPITEEPQNNITVPTLDTFNFQSPFPSSHQESYLNIANLDLSDSAKANETGTQSPSTGTHNSRSRNHVKRPRPQPTNALGKGAGQKRPINFAELFDVGNIGSGKDVFGRNGKRPRH